MTTKEENPGGWESDHLAQEAKSQEPQQLTIQEEQTEFRPISTEETLPPFFHNVEAAAQDTPIPDVPTSPLVGSVVGEAWQSANLTGGDQQQPKTAPAQQRWLARKPLHVGLLMRRPLNRVLLLLVVLLLVTGAYVAARPRLPAGSATVRITPTSQTVVDSNSNMNITPDDTDPAKNPIGARRIAHMTSTQSMHVLATGKGHQKAMYANGTVTVTVEQGPLTPNKIIVLTSNSGVQVILLTPSVVTLTAQGTIDLHAIALYPGAGGNIAADDIDGTYYNTQNPSQVIFAENKQPFTGGQDDMDYTFVQQSDIDAVVSKLESQLADQVPAAKATVQGQLAANEQFLNDIQCYPHVTTNHRANDRAQDVTVSVAITCTGIAYSVEKLSDFATNMASQQATFQLGGGMHWLAR